MNNVIENLFQKLILFRKKMHNDKKFRKVIVFRVLYVVTFIVAVFTAWGLAVLPNVSPAQPASTGYDTGFLGEVEVSPNVSPAQPVSTVVPPTEVVRNEKPSKTPVPATPTSQPSATPTKAMPTLEMPYADGKEIRVGTYDFSIPYYRELRGKSGTFYKSKLNEIDPRLSFLVNGNVETIYYTDDAPVHTINGKEYIGVYLKSELDDPKGNLFDKKNKNNIFYVEKSKIQPALEANHPAEVYLRNRLTTYESSFELIQMKSKRDVYRAIISFYVLNKVHYEYDLCDSNSYGVVDILVYIPGKGLRKHGLAVFSKPKNSDSDDYSALVYPYSLDLAQKGMEEDQGYILFSFANHKDFKQYFYAADWFNKTTKFGDADSDWDTEYGRLAYSHASCFAGEYEKFLRTQGDEYSVFLVVEFVRTGYFVSHLSDDKYAITPDEFEAISDAVGYTPELITVDPSTLEP